jgi:hypothetical protein
MKMKIYLLLICLFAFEDGYSQGTLHLKNGRTVYTGTAPFKSIDKLYFYRIDTLFWVSKAEIAYLVGIKYQITENSESELILDTIAWDKIKAHKTITDYSKLDLIKKYANRSSAGIVMTLVVPAVTGVLALQQGVVEIAYIGLASSAIGIGLWLSGIQQLRTALELGEAIHYTR